jgi:hypothetical protein
MNQEDTGKIALPLDWHIREEVRSQYANNVLVQAGQYEIVISFFETILPILTGQPEENKSKLEALGAIHAELVSRIVISPELVPGLIQALEASLENYRQTRGQA